MNRNVELKARVESLVLIEQLLRARGLEPRLLVQRDTFFGCPNGRLKLRDGRVLRVRPGRCEAVHTDQTLTWEADRGDHFTLYSGMVDLVSAERGQGYSFPYGDLANAQHFVAALSAVAGLPAR